MANNNSNLQTDKIKVKSGQGEIRYYNIKPKMPVDGVAQDWDVTAVDGSPVGLIGSYDIRFKTQSSTLQAFVEQAILVFVIDNSDPAYHWQFVHGGLQINEFTGDRAGRTEVRVLDNGLAMQLTVSRPTDGQDGINTRFVAARTDLASGNVEIVTSSDPDIRRARR